jgi:hypothetical protein
MGLDDVVCDCQVDRRLRSRVGGQPVIGVGGRVGKPDVQHDQLGATLPGFCDPLGVGVEVVPCLEMG